MSGQVSLTTMKNQDFKSEEKNCMKTRHRGTISGRDELGKRDKCNKKDKSGKKINAVRKRN